MLLFTSVFHSDLWMRKTKILNWKWLQTIPLIGEPLRIWRIQSVFNIWNIEYLQIFSRAWGALQRQSLLFTSPIQHSEFSTFALFYKKNKHDVHHGWTHPFRKLNSCFHKRAGFKLHILRNTFLNLLNTFLISASWHRMTHQVEPAAYLSEPTRQNLQWLLHSS